MNTLTCVCLFALFALICGAPNISNNYWGNVMYTATIHGHTENSNGTHYVDWTNKRERFDLDRHDVNTEALDLFSVHKFYDIVATHCFERTRNESMREPWGWVANAKNLGTCTSNGMSGTVWGMSDAADTFGVCVASDNMTPYYVENKRANGDYVKETFVTWNAGVPNASNFAVPSDCPSN